ncbi:MLP-like protein 423 [Silene latifolia]|uniref:MLP-like protein 423 n=1 Tax=Silene latifolia TaxID=37657 RepID=UPI003D76F165
MGSIEKLEADVELKSESIKVWGAVKDSPNFFPKAMPHHYKSIEIVEGADHVVGSVRLVTYADGNPIKTTKEKIDVVDDEKKTLAYSVVDGEGITHYKSFKAQVVVEEKGEGSLVKWTCEYEKIKEDEELPISPENLKEFAIATFKELDDFLLKAN